MRGCPGTVELWEHDVEEGLNKLHNQVAGPRKNPLKMFVYRVPDSGH